MVDFANKFDCGMDHGSPVTVMMNGEMFHTKEELGHADLSEGAASQYSTEYSTGIYNSILADGEKGIMNL